MLRKIEEEIWFYILEFDDETDEYLLDVACGTVGIYTVKIKLNSKEIDAYKTDPASIRALANRIVNQPTNFFERRV